MPENGSSNNLSLIKRKGIKLLHVNAQSFLPKFEEFMYFVTANDLSIISINETWLTETVHDSEIHIEGYVIS